MKNNLAKIFASASIVVALILIMILIVTAFGGIQTEEFESKLVRGLILTVAIIYALLSIITLGVMFSTSDTVQEITVCKEKDHALRVSAKVVNKMIKRSCAQVEGVKCKKVALVADDFGVRAKINVKVIDKDTVEAETHIRLLVEDTFRNEFGFAFTAIEVKVMKLEPKYKPNDEEINARVAQAVAEVKEHEAEEAAIAQQQAEEQAEEAAKAAEEATQEVNEEEPAQVEVPTEEVAEVPAVEDVDQDVEAPADNKED